MAAGVVLPAAAAAIVRHLTPAGVTAARRAVLVASDLGRGWTSTPAPAQAPGPTCSGFHPALPGVVESGAAVSRTFAQTSSGPFVSSTVDEFQTPAELQTVWGRLITRRFVACAAESLTTASGGAIRYVIDSKRDLVPPPGGGRRRAYRVLATAVTGGQSIPVYLDVIVLGRGAALATISIAGFSAPPAPPLERALARAVTRRLGS